jgi:hypothetical protein
MIAKVVGHFTESFNDPLARLVILLDIDEPIHQVDQLSMLLVDDVDLKVETRFPDNLLHSHLTWLGLPMNPPKSTASNAPRSAVYVETAPSPDGINQ